MINYCSDPRFTLVEGQDQGSYLLCGSCPVGRYNLGVISYGPNVKQEAPEDWRTGDAKHWPVGGQSGRCTCPNGESYRVGDNWDDCESLACVNGISDLECDSPRDLQGKFRKVVCGVGEAIDNSGIQCKGCPPGMFTPNSSSACIACPAGRFQNLEMAIAYQCRYCDKGQFYVAPNTSCKACPFGKFQSR